MIKRDGRFLSAWAAAMSSLMVCGALIILPCGVVAQTTGTAVAEDATTVPVEAAETVEESGETTDTADAQSMPEAKVETVYDVVLLGEVVGANENEPGEGPFPDLADLTSGTLGGSITDLTTVGVTMADLAEQVARIGSKPGVAVIFIGFSDENKPQPRNDESQRLQLKQAVAALKKVNADMNIFLVPATPSVGAMISANMRMAASDTGATFVSIGTEGGGQPHLDALLEVKKELEAGPEETTEEPEAEQSNSVMIRRGQVEELGRSEAGSFEQQKADLQQELERIAGESGEASLAIPRLDDAGTTAFIDSTTTGGAIPPGGVVTKRGSEARDESIKMKSLPAVKAFRPQIPVPRNEVNVKEPALSR